MKNNKKKVMLAHYRVGMTDGVSLEIDKRREILRQLDYDTFLVSGPKSNNSDYIIDTLNFDDAKINELTQTFFDKNIEEKVIEPLLKQLDIISVEIKTQLRKIVEKEKPDYIFAHNIFSHGRHIAASKAFLEIIEEFKIPTLGMHHDFYFERPKYTYVRNAHLIAYLNKYIPPVSKYIRHAVINTIAKEALFERRQIPSIVITDTFDFDQQPWQKDDYNKDLVEIFKSKGINENDITILQATRIVSRKSIEFTIELVNYINENNLLSKYANKALYNGKQINKDSKIHLIIVGYAEEDGIEYLNELKDFSKDYPYIHFLSNIIQSERSFNNNIKHYSLWDSYCYVDAVSYPSTFEGWGNQFIEAVFARLPIICYEYPVFKTDIKPFGYNYISLGDKYIDNIAYKELKSLNIEQLCKTSDNLLKCLFKKETNDLIEENFKIGREFHSFTSLKNNLKEVLYKLNEIK
ncbi:MAG: glycosyltransferase [Pleomorphochaeta sp.]